MVNVAVRAARAAGAIINHAALDLGSVRVAQKRIGDFVTEIDRASEAAIIETLLTAYPKHGILAEESGQEHGAPDAEYVWIIDPLDGTTNFIHGFPVYAVSIALVVRGRVEHAVIYDPTRNDLFTATRGRGAFMNNRRMRASSRRHLPESLIATGLPHRAGDDFAMPLRVLAALMPRTAGIRRAGAAALDLAYVAAGFADGFFERGLKPWDVAAGALLVTEAGGLIGNFAGGAFDMDAGECLAASPRIYAQLVSILSPYSRFGETENVPATRAKGTLKATAAKEESDEEKTGENEEQSK